MKEILASYQSLQQKNNQDYLHYKKRYKLIGGIRLLVILLFFYLLYSFIVNDTKADLYFAAIALIVFLVFVKVSGRISFKRKLSKTLVTINADELSYLNKDSIPFEDGSEYIEAKHPYSFDLDFFGKHSLFQNMNRTATYIGKERLAFRLKSILKKDEILENQNAIKELSERVEFRQYTYALAKISNDNKALYNDLLSWLKSSISKQSRIGKLFSIISPIVLVVLFVIYFSGGSILYRSLGITLFFINLSVLASHLKAIRNELINDSKIDEILKNYSLIIQSIENERFSSPKLIKLQASLRNETIEASKQIKHLSSLFSQLDSLQNLVGALLMNGIALYHLHVFRSLMKWKQDHSDLVVEWLGVIAEFEVLGSFANFSFNNPDFCFPEVNEEGKIAFTDIGHPLIDAKSRVDNTVDFSKEKFIILTGSNMSGKSTFLRSLGVNMVLASIGSPICASKATITPSMVWVSMRLSDSLEDNESYFFAEVKRLKEIMIHTEEGPSFILLDEILRGTNSDDKRLGTVEVIKKLISKNAVGAIATHDLEVCLTTEEYPEKLTNKCFEVEIVDNELHFDYRLREGICKNKSATFLMEKMGVI